MNDPILDPLRTEMQIQVLRYAAGRAIFCPGGRCHGAVLDAAAMVLVGTTPICRTCWEGATDEVRASVLAVEPADDPYLDGAALHGLDPIIIRPEPRTECDGQMTLEV